jgi:hypothetical protein
MQSSSLAGELQAHPAGYGQFLADTSGRKCTFRLVAYGTSWELLSYFSKALRRSHWYPRRQGRKGKLMHNA